MATARVVARAVRASLAARVPSVSRDPPLLVVDLLQAFLRDTQVRGARARPLPPRKLDMLSDTHLPPWHSASP